MLFTKNNNKFQIGGKIISKCIKMTKNRRVKELLEGSV